MGKIAVMPSRLANMIAAGEVIERPSSIIKELVENSLDAHAKNIEVEIFNAGRSKIIVRDDGDGMDKDDAKLAFTRHASSKLLDEYQLFKIKTTLSLHLQPVQTVQESHPCHDVRQNSLYQTEWLFHPDFQISVPAQMLFQVYRNESCGL